MLAFLKIAKSSVAKAGVRGCVTWVIHVACLHIHVLVRAFGDASERRDVKARHSFCPDRSGGAGKNGKCKMENGK